MIRSVLCALLLFACASASAGCARSAVDMRIVPVGDHWQITYYDRHGRTAVVTGKVLAETLDAPQGWKFAPGWRRCEWRPDLGEWIVIENGIVTRRKSL